MIALFGIIFSVHQAVAQNKTRSNPIFFEPDYNNAGLENAQPPSDSVLDAVLKKIEADELGEDIKQMSREQKRALFEAVGVDLGPPSGAYFVVHGRPPMIGADCEWFWVVRVIEGKGKALLFSNGLALELQKHATNGYRDIEVSWATAAVTGDRVYRFDGSSYRLFHEQTREQKP